MTPELKTRNVFIDTSVFRGVGFNYNSRKMRGFASLAENKRIFVKLTDITVREIEANIEDSLFAANQALETFKNRAYILRNVSISPFVELFGELDFIKIKNKLQEQLHGFLREFDVEVLSTDNVSPKEVFDKYFACKPPFGKEKKKSEFPDAFVASALQSWCNENGENIYVISGDGDMQKACQDIESLLYLESVEEFTDLIIGADNDLSAFVHQLLDKHDEILRKEISKRFRVLPMRLLDKDGEVLSARVNEVEIENALIVTLEGNSAVIQISAVISFDASVRYISQTLYDHRERTIVPIRHYTREVLKRSESVPVEALITFSETKPDYLSVEKITINNENVVEIIVDEDALYFHYYYEQYYGDHEEDNQDIFDF